MSSNIAERERLGTLQRNYRRAWEALMREAEALQRVAKSDGDSAEVTDARARVETAAKNYRAARNDLAQVLLGGIGRAHVVKTESQRELLVACSAGH
jgi:hypothetical protein